MLLIQSAEKVMWVATDNKPFSEDCFPFLCDIRRPQNDQAFWISRKQNMAFTNWPVIFQVTFTTDENSESHIALGAWVSKGKAARLVRKKSSKWALACDCAQMIAAPAVQEYMCVNKSWCQDAGLQKVSCPATVHPNQQHPQTKQFTTHVSPRQGQLTSLIASC